MPFRQIEIICGTGGAPAATAKLQIPVEDQSNRFLHDGLGHSHSSRVRCRSAVSSVGPLRAKIIAKAAIESSQVILA